MPSAAVLWNFYLVGLYVLFDIQSNFLPRLYPETTASSSFHQISIPFHQVSITPTITMPLNKKQKNQNKNPSSSACSSWLRDLQQQHKKQIYMLSLQKCLCNVHFFLWGFGLFGLLSCPFAFSLPCSTSPTFGQS